MKKIRISYFLLGLAILCALALVYYYDPFHLFQDKDQFEVRASESVLGYYNPQSEHPADEPQNLQHYTLKWNNTSEEELPDAGEEALAANEGVLLTLEIWPAGRKKKSYRATWKAILKGEYDDKLKQLCATLSNREQPTYLRWNPEMEVPVKLLPWQYQDPETYIKAFRHIASLCKSAAPAVQMVWGPAGYPGSLEYWPGEDVVDRVSITLGSESEDRTTVYPKEPSMLVTIQRKLHRLRFVDKPAMILVTDKVKHETYNADQYKLDIDTIQQYLTAIKQPGLEKTNKLPLTASLTTGIRRVEGRQKGGAASGKIIGVYDPELELAGHRAVTVEHLFTDLDEIREGNFRKSFHEAISRNHDVIVTMEPKDTTLDKRGPNVLEKTLQGDYDEYIKELFEIISEVDRTVYLRWAHEMEIPIERYQWQSQDPVLYIRAYRYFVELGKPLANNIRLVWGPAGDRGSLEWWPGDDYVDYISIAVYGLPDKNISDHRKQESFRQIFNRKIRRMRFVNKPVFITEFGVKGPDDYQKSWLEGAAETVRASPDVVGVCYFNQHDSPDAWGDIEAPDWSISNQSFRQFAESLTAAD